MSVHDRLLRFQERYTSCTNLGKIPLCVLHSSSLRENQRGGRRRRERGRRRGGDGPDWGREEQKKRRWEREEEGKKGMNQHGLVGTSVKSGLTMFSCRFRGVGGWLGEGWKVNGNEREQRLRRFALVSSLLLLRWESSSSSSSPSTTIPPKPINHAT